MATIELVILLNWPKVWLFIYFKEFLIGIFFFRTWLRALHKQGTETWYYMVFIFWKLVEIIENLVHGSQWSRQKSRKSGNGYERIVYAFSEVLIYFLVLIHNSTNIRLLMKKRNLWILKHFSLFSTLQNITLLLPIVQIINNIF